jgi:HAD superfamily hydrolase (TIGR01509 family)
MSNVLYDATLWRRWLLRILRRLGLHTEYRAFYHIWDHDYLVDVNRGRRDFCEAFRCFLLAAGLSRGQAEEVEAACQAKRRHWESDARLLPGVKNTLSELHKAGLKLGVLADSEHPASVLEERLAHLGVNGLFSTVISSVEIAKTRPDPVTYMTALRAMDLPAGQAAFVGHSAEDLAGAANVGMTTIAFNYDPESEADAFTARFDELLDVLGVRSRYAAAG